MKPDVNLVHADCLEFLRSLPESSVDLVLTDPPYFRVVDQSWDKQWRGEPEFLDWLELVVIEYARVLKPTGGLYLFCNPYLAAKVEVMIGRHLGVLNHIIWRKNAGRWSGCRKESLRKYFPQTERIVFAESKKKCGFAQEPVYQYLRSALDRSGMTQKQVNDRLGNQMSGHWFGRSQFSLPSSDNYRSLQLVLPGLDMPYEELHSWFSGIRSTKERRVFGVTKDVPFTDVWDFGVVRARSGKHACEKPADLIEHMIMASSNPGDLVLDSFTGSGAVLKACVKLGRSFTGCELDQHWFDHLKNI